MRRQTAARLRPASAASLWIRVLRTSSGSVSVWLTHVDSAPAAAQPSTYGFTPLRFRRRGASATDGLSAGPRIGATWVASNAASRHRIRVFIAMRARERSPARRLRYVVLAAAESCKIKSDGEERYLDDSFHCVASRPRQYT